MIGKMTGSMMIVAGTTIGAGMLAIPIVTGELGFLLSTVLLVVCWAVMMLTAFLVLHVNMAFKEHSNFSTMAAQTIGKTGRALTWISYLLLLYSLVAAYITGGAALFGHSLNLAFNVNISSILCAIIFTVVLGVFVYFGTRSVDYANRILISLKFGAFILMLIFLFPHVHVENLSFSSHSPMNMLIALPIILTSFGCHIVIPNLRDYMHSDVKKLKKIIFFGGLIPLVVYVLWEIVVLGAAPEVNHKQTLIQMIDMLSTRLAHPWLIFVVNFFTDVAITTSFLGVSMSLFHFIRDCLHLNQNRTGEKALAFLVTFIPPLIFAKMYPQGFVTALSYAGVIIVVLLILIPLWMTLNLKKKEKVSAYPFRLHWTGIVAMLAFSALVVVAQFMNAL